MKKTITITEITKNDVINILFSKDTTEQFKICLTNGIVKTITPNATLVVTCDYIQEIKDSSINKNNYKANGGSKIYFKEIQSIEYVLSN